MSSKSIGNAFRQFVDKLKSSNIVQKQNELQDYLSGPLSLCREKIDILETDEALTVLSRIDADYNADLKKNVEGIFYEEQGRANTILDELDSILLDLQVQLDGVLQRLQNDSQKLSNLSLPLSSYEDARGLFVFLKLRTNLLRLKCSVAIDEPFKDVKPDSDYEFENGEFLLRLSKLEVSSELLEGTL